MRTISLSIALAMLVMSCQEKPKTKEDTNTQNTKFQEVEDHHSYSNAADINPQHLSLDIAVDFEAQKIKGQATWTLAPKSGVDKAIFDTYQVQVDSVLYADGSHANYKIGKHDSVLGSALEVDLNDNKEIQIYYETTDKATSLLWLTPEQTFGKKDPYMFTQGEPINTRSWIPSPDSPGSRFTYDAKVQVPEGLLAIMSAENPQEKSADGIYTFNMEQKIPAYLIALAVGDIEFKAVDHRTGVYSEPFILDKAHKELDGIGEMVNIAEGLYGDYRWDRFDVLILPSGFPMGGMENPRLTFATPTILAGDKTLLNLIAHELAHSWSGNLVTGATWDDLWLNEGFTAYIERRITEAEHGAEYTAMLWDLAEKKVDDAIRRAGDDKRSTWVNLDLKGKDPDLAFTRIPYDKGSALLLLIEQTVGRETMDNFLRTYFDAHAFETMHTARFLEYIDEHLFSKNPEWKEQIRIEDWVYGPDKLDNYPKVKNVRFERVAEEVAKFNDGAKAKDINSENWTTHEWLYFFEEINSPLSLAQMQDLDAKYNFTNSTNSEIESAWFIQSLKANYDVAYPQMEKFLFEVGRGKFLNPIYEQMLKTDAEMAKEIYEKSRANYHPMVQRSIDLQFTE